MAEQFDVLLYNTSGTVVTPAHGIKFTFERAGQLAWGGPSWAQISATGSEEALGTLLNFLTYQVLVVDRMARPVWWGYIEEAFSPSGDRLIGRSLKGMFNRIAVTYTEDRQRKTTAWAQDSESVALYGKREKLASIPDGRAQQAEAARETELLIQSTPAPSYKAESKGTALLECHGHWEHLKHTYYGSTEGYERHLTGTAIEKIGQSAFSSAAIRFEDNKIILGSVYHDVDTDKVQKTGQLAYSGTAIGFEDGTDGSRIYDLDNQLGGFVRGEVITVSGTALNDGTYLIDTATASDITTLDDVDDEAVGTATITPSSYFQIAQSFTTKGGVLRKIRIKAGRAGNASDGLLCAVLASSGGSPTGTQLDGATVAAVDMTDEADWIEYDYGGGFSFVNGTTYWAVLIRTGAESSQSGYFVAVDEDNGYAGGTMKVNNGSSWVNRPTPADMIFEIIYEPTDGFDAFVSGDTVVVSGSASNNGTYNVKSVSLEAPATLTVEDDLVTEGAGATVTIATRYTKLAQRFQINDAEGWTLSLARIKAMKVNAPTDGLTLQIHEDNAGAISTSLATATVDAALISDTSLALVPADFGTTLDLVSGTFYWLSAKRTGSESSQHGYVLQVDDDAGYGDGTLQGWNGTSWGNRTPASDMVFELIGVRETTAQIKKIIESTGLFAGVEIRTSSGVYASPYYEGNLLAMTAVETLLKSGTASGAPLVAIVTSDRWVRIEAAPSQNDAYGIKRDNSLVDGRDRAIPSYLAPVGVWARLLDLPGTVDVATFGSAALLYLEGMEYDARRGTLRPTARQSRNPFAFARTREG